MLVPIEQLNTKATICGILVSLFSRYLFTGYMVQIDVWNLFSIYDKDQRRF